MYLILMQHAKSKSKEEDPERGITETGKMETERVSEYLKLYNFQIDEIWHSTKKRSRETAEIVTSMNRYKNKISEKDFLSPMDNVKPAVKILNSRKKNIMIVGHLPYLSRLSSALITGSEDYQVLKFINSGIVTFVHEDNFWKILSINTP